MIGQFLIVAKLEEHDIRVLILGMGREVARLRHIPILAKATSNRPRSSSGRFCLLRCSIKSTACESRLMRDALTIVVVHISRQQDQSLLHVGQELLPQGRPGFPSARR